MDHLELVQVKKLLPLLPYAFALLVCVAFVLAIKNVLKRSDAWDDWRQDTTRYFTEVEVAKLIRDSNAVILAQLDSVVEVSRNATLRHRIRRDSLKGVADSLTTALRTSTDSLVSRHDALRAIETLEGSLGEARKESQALEAINVSQAQMLSVAKLENDRLWRLVDSASAVIRRVPKSCTIPLTGIPCPSPVVGVGVTVDGPRAFVGVGFRL